MDPNSADVESATVTDTTYHDTIYNLGGWFSVPFSARSDSDVKGATTSGTTTHLETDTQVLLDSVVASSTASSMGDGSRCDNGDVGDDGANQIRELPVKHAQVECGVFCLLYEKRVEWCIGITAEALYDLKQLSLDKANFMFTADLRVVTVQSTTNRKCENFVCECCTRVMAYEKRGAEYRIRSNELPFSDVARRILNLLVSKDWPNSCLETTGISWEQLRTEKTNTGVTLELATLRGIIKVCATVLNRIKDLVIAANKLLDWVKEVEDGSGE